MKLEFITPYHSIKSYDSVNLSDLTVLIGLNGAGKTQLLESIKNGSSQIDQTPQHKISYYSPETFKVLSSNNIKGNELQNLQKQAWHNLHSGNNKIKPKILSNSYYNQAFLKNNNDGTRSDLWNDRKPDNRKIWGESRYSVDYERARIHYADLVNLGIFDHQGFRSFQFHKDIIKAIRKINKPIHLISEEEFTDYFVPSVTAENHLAISVSAIFTKYKIRQFNWIIGEQQKHRSEKLSFDDLASKFEEEFPKPWEKLNEIIREIHIAGGRDQVFNFSITNPDHDKITLQNYQTYSFVPQLLDNKMGEPRDFEKLSSGEKVLLALALTIFESYDGYTFPDVILLDEIDASLHPSMTNALLQTLSSAFIANDVKVILATHAPSTVALCDEDSLFIMEKSDRIHRIFSANRATSMELITEGYATLETGLAIFNDCAQNSITLISEGHNADIIERVCQLYDQNDVTVIGCFKGKSGKDQLKVLYQFFTQASHQKAVLFVLDCDVSTKPDKDNNYWLTLPKNNENDVAKKGIENIFNVNDLDGFLSKKFDSRNRETVEFDESRKLDFKNHIVNNGTKETFKVFQPLLDKLQQIRSA